MCRMHANRVKRTGDPSVRGRSGYAPRPAGALFWKKVDKDGTTPDHRPDLGPCWIWTAASHAGRGQFRYGGKLYKAHRYAYELLVGPIPDDLELDHLCVNLICVNPAHLEPVTHRVNVQRAAIGGVALKNIDKTHCPKGHPYDEQNTYVWGGTRRCRLCLAAYQRGWKQRQRTP